MFNPVATLLTCRMQDGDRDSSSSDYPQKSSRRKKQETVSPGRHLPTRPGVDQSEEGPKDNETESEELVKQLQTVSIANSECLCILYIENNVLKSNIGELMKKSPSKVITTSLRGNGTKSFYEMLMQFAQLV